MKRMIDMNQRHSYNHIRKEDGTEVWQCRHCGREVSYVCEALRPQSDFNLPCKKDGVVRHGQP